MKSKYYYMQLSNIYKIESDGIYLYALCDKWMYVKDAPLINFDTVYNCNARQLHKKLKNSSNFLYGFLKKQLVKEIFYFEVLK